MHVTLQTIADAEGVSRMTVSRAMRNDPGISTETRERILKRAATLGYRPDPLVSALMMRLRKIQPYPDAPVMAYLTTYQHNTGFGSFAYLRQHLEGARARAAALGFRLDEFNLPELEITAKKLGQVLRARGVRGLIVAPLPKAGRMSMDFKPFAAAALGTSLLSPDLHRVLTNPVRNMALALRELRSLGLRRIGLVLDERGDRRAEHIMSARMVLYNSRMQAKERVPPLILPEVEKEPVLQWVDQYQPEALLCFAYQIGHWLRTRGGFQPRIINMNWSAKDGSDYGIDQQPDLVGSAGVDLVVEQLYTNQYGVPENAKTIMLSGRWVTGGAQNR